MPDFPLHILAQRYKLRRLLNIPVLCFLLGPIDPLGCRRSRHNLFIRKLDSAHVLDNSLSSPRLVEPALPDATGRWFVYHFLEHAWNSSLPVSSQSSVIGLCPSLPTVQYRANFQPIHD
jgi:hypothetical protein